MNEAEARGIYETDGSCMSHEGWEAKGYLEAIEKAKGLEVVIRKYLHPHNGKEVKCGNCYLNMRNALAKWEAEK